MSPSSERTVILNCDASGSSELTMYSLTVIALVMSTSGINESNVHKRNMVHLLYFMKKQRSVKNSERILT